MTVTDGAKRFFERIQQIENEVPKAPEFETCFVAYIDILGFKEFVDSGGDAAPRLMTDIYKAFRFDRSLDYQHNFIEHRMFSDSVMIWCKHSNPHSFWNLLNQIDLVRGTFLKHGFLLRGGLSYGKHFCASEVLVSKALIDAYQIEQRATYPRICIDRRILALKDMVLTKLETGTTGVSHGGTFLLENPDRLRNDFDGELILCPFRASSNLCLLADGDTRTRVPGDAEYTPEQVMAFKADGIQKLKEYRDQLEKRANGVRPTASERVQQKINYLIEQYNGFLKQCVDRGESVVGLELELIPR